MGISDGTVITAPHVHVTGAPGNIPATGTGLPHPAHCMHDIVARDLCRRMHRSAFTPRHVTAIFPAPQRAQPVLLPVVTMHRFFAVLLLAACHTAPEYPDVGNGALQNGTFTYECVSQADSFCTESGRAALVPDGIALGSTFRISFENANGVDGNIDLQGTTQLTLAPDGMLHADKTGYAAIFGLSNDHVDDFLNLHVVMPASLRVIGIDATSTLQPGDARSVHAEPLDSAGRILAGAGTWDWETSDPNIVSVEVSSVGFASLRANNPGLARIRVVYGSATSTVDVLVGNR